MEKATVVNIELKKSVWGHVRTKCTREYAAFREL